MKYKELAKLLAENGCHEIPRRRGGSHRKWHNPANGQATIIPDWGSKELKQGTIAAIFRQLGLTMQAVKRG